MPVFLAKGREIPLHLTVSIFLYNCNREKNSSARVEFLADQRPVGSCVFTATASAPNRVQNIQFHVALSLGWDGFL